ncbi:MAG: septum formation initiator family protein [Treponema sp.]|jgi:cell division protein FtsB|nr:septum formation initiator family protein [Treponema sp.]
MKTGKYLLVPWFILAVYTGISVYHGPAGILSYRELRTEREVILENLDRLKDINRKLEGTMDALLYDPETIRVKARELGYGTPEERFVRIVGLPGGRRSDMRPGTIRGAVRPQGSSVRAHRIVALCLGLLLFSAFLAGDLFWKT